MSKKILVIDDEAGVREVLTEYQQKEGYKVTAVESGNEGLTHVKREAFDLAIRLDWRKDKYNPAKLVKRYPEQARERYLSDEEYPRLFAELAER